MLALNNGRDDERKALGIPSLATSLPETAAAAAALPPASRSRRWSKTEDAEGGGAAAALGARRG